MPITSSLRAPDSRHLTFRREISQGIARRRVGNLRIDEKKNQRASDAAHPDASDADF
jgi:hypothetical protein